VSGAATVTPVTIVLIVTVPTPFVYSGTLTFWALDPAGHTLNPVSFTTNGAAFTKVGAGDKPPTW
jgi:hypothetical protein